MRSLSLALIVLLSLCFVSWSDAATKCGNHDDCSQCLNDPICGWYNYTNSCAELASGLPLETDQCGPNPRQNIICNLYTLGGCAACAVQKNCAFDSVDNKCYWDKYKPGLINDYRRCPYNPRMDKCRVIFIARCEECISQGCSMYLTNTTCYDGTWISMENSANSMEKCPTTPYWELRCSRDNQRCSQCIENSQVRTNGNVSHVCGWDGECKPSNMGGSLLYNSTLCPYNSTTDICLLTNSSCHDCTKHNDGYQQKCGWSTSLKSCHSYRSNISDLISNDFCPYEPQSDQCKSNYFDQCFSALTKGKLTCGWDAKNNSAIELRSGLQLMTDATKCPPISGDNTCTNLYQRAIHKDECESCVQIEECGWSVSDQTCYGLNMENSTFPLLKAQCPSLNCTEQKTCKECSQVKDWACGWSFVKNHCVQSKNRFIVHQFPNMSWSIQEPTDPTIALNCDLEPQDCSAEYMEKYTCNKTTEEYPFDIQNCYTNSAVKSPSCVAGFFQVNESSTDFWGKRKVNYRTVKCCPGYFCPENFICAKKCPLGSHCVLSRANYTKSDPFDDPMSSMSLVQDEGDSEDNTTKPIYCFPYLPMLISPQLGCGGATTDSPCKEGYYCENTTSQLTCPKDNFCRKATVTPTSCYGPPFFKLLFIGIDCPRGTVFPQTRMYILLAVPLLLVVIPLGFYIYSRISRHLAAKEKQRKEDLKRKSELFLINKDPSIRNYGAIIDPIDPEVDLEIDVNSLYIQKIKPLNISFDNLTVTLPDGKVILDRIDGTLYSGRLTAIMGPSGSGKTTLLSAIMGKCGGRSGKVYPKMRKCKSVLGFVPQEDVMHRELTVRENLNFSAKLRGSRSISRQQRLEIVRVVLEFLGLTAVANSVVGDENVRGISGGQRKRVNIGMELVILPSVLFLDEPTSGLDSFTSLSVCQVLKKLTEVHVNVVAVIHQPRYDIFDQFDDILLLRKGGSLVYTGPKDNVVQHFANQGFVCPLYQNPCDYLLDLISGPSEIKANKGKITMEDTQLQRRETTGRLMQVWWIFLRGLVQQWRNYNTFYSDILLCIFSGVVVGMVYRNVAENLIPQAAFLLVLVSSLTSVVISLRLFGSEKSVFWRESASGLSSISYFFGKNLSSFPSYIITGVIFLLFYYSISQPRGSYGMYFYILMVNHFCISGLSHFLSVMMHPHKAQLFSVIATMLQCSICGFAPTLTTLKDISLVLYYGAYVSFAKWMMEALFIVNVQNFSEALDDSRDNMVQVFGYSMDNLTKCLVVLLGMGIFWRICTLLALIFANRKQRR